MSPETSAVLGKDCPSLPYIYCYRWKSSTLHVPLKWAPNFENLRTCSCSGYCLSSSPPSTVSPAETGDTVIPIAFSLWEFFHSVLRTPISVASRQRGSLSLFLSSCLRWWCFRQKCEGWGGSICFDCDGLLLRSNLASSPLNQVSSILWLCY